MASGSTKRQTPSIVVEIVVVLLAFVLLFALAVKPKRFSGKSDVQELQERLQTAPK